MENLSASDPLWDTRSVVDNGVRLQRVPNVPRPSFSDNVDMGATDECSVLERG